MDNQTKEQSMTANESQVGGTHYKTDYEHWDLAIAIPLGYLEGCATKYVSRWRKKEGIKDLQKALHYLDKLMETAEYPILRKLSYIDIMKEIDRFAHANNLSIMDKKFVELMSTYKDNLGLQEARYVLNEIIEFAESFVTPKKEPNYPGTPEDGGHHEIQPV
jgi:hypothetical protein